MNCAQRFKKRKEKIINKRLALTCCPVKALSLFRSTTKIKKQENDKALPSKLFLKGRNKEKLENRHLVKIKEDAKTKTFSYVRGTRSCGLMIPYVFSSLVRNASFPIEESDDFPHASGRAKNAAFLKAYDSHMIFTDSRNGPQTYFWRHLRNLNYSLGKIIYLFAQLLIGHSSKLMLSSGEIK